MKPAHSLTPLGRGVVGFFLLTFTLFACIAAGQLWQIAGEP